jgi:hypothetical protein
MIPIHLLPLMLPDLDSALLAVARQLGIDLQPWRAFVPQVGDGATTRTLETKIAGPPGRSVLIVDWQAQNNVIAAPAVSSAPSTLLEIEPDEKQARRYVSQLGAFDYPLAPMFFRDSLRLRQSLPSGFDSTVFFPATGNAFSLGGYSCVHKDAERLRGFFGDALSVILVPDPIAVVSLTVPCRWRVSRLQIQDLPFPIAAPQRLVIRLGSLAFPREGNANTFSGFFPGDGGLQRNNRGASGLRLSPVSLIAGDAVEMDPYTLGAITNGDTAFLHVQGAAWNL